MRRWLGWLVGVLALVSGSAAWARDLPVPADKGWKHARTGVILRASIAGLQRTKLFDNGQDEFDVVADFETPDHSTVATIYLFHPALPSVPIWFDRSDFYVRHREMYGGVDATASAPQPIILAGSPGQVGLRQSYVPHQSFKGTALAVVNVGEWLVAVRVSNLTGDVAATDQLLSAVLSGIGWPPLKGIADATPIADCPTSLAYKKAKVVKPDGAQLLVSALMPRVAAEEAAKKPADVKPVHRCRGQGATADYGVYRADDDSGGYTLALYDSGRTAALTPALIGGGYAVTRTDLDGSTSVFASFSDLAKPEQVFQMVTNGRPAGKGDGGNVTLSPDAAK